MSPPTDAEVDGAGSSGLPVGDLLHHGPPTVDLPPPDSALAIGAHPDDVEFGAGATLAKWAAAGCRVHHLVLTDGSKGSWDPAADLASLIRERQAESHAAAAVIDAEAPPVGADRVIFLGRVDGELVDGADERREVARIIRSFRPEIVLAHDPWRRYRLHPDHRAAGFLSIGAVVAARDPHFFPELDLAPHRPAALLLFEADLPNHVETASGFEDTKIRSLLCHRSQSESTFGIGESGVDPGSGLDSPESDAFASRIRGQLASHGALAGIPAGEAFHLIRP